ncbi:MAG TPA: lanthionine synthetase C family protein [Nonomuraea sp.]|nr:lanthionine synthetase C family protein [Nonomuraea sp.]
MPENGPPEPALTGTTAAMAAEATMAAEAAEAAITILRRLADDNRVGEVAASAEWLVGRPVWHRDASLYGGAAGHALAFAHAAAVLDDEDGQWWEQARRWLRIAADSTRTAPLSSCCLGYGTAGVAAAAAAAREVDARYGPALLALHRDVAAQVDGMSPPDPEGVAFPDYDVVGGPAGVLAHLASAAPAEGPGQAAERLADRLAGMAAAGDGDPWAGWRVPRRNYPRRDIEHELYPYGYVDLGLAHGIPGPLAALSRAWTAGDRRPPVREALEGLAGQLVAASRFDRYGRAWPRVMPFSAAGRIAPEMAETADAAYCYGPPGICSALLDAADALEDTALRAVAVDGFEAALRRLADDGPPSSSGLCHGVAGLLVICRKFAAATGSATAAAAAAELTGVLLSRCDPALPLAIQESTVAEDGGEIRIDDPGLLSGATGVALALLMIGTGQPDRWSRTLVIGR